MSLPNLVQLGLRIRAILRSVRVKGPPKIGPSKMKINNSDKQYPIVMLFGTLVFY